LRHLPAVPGRAHRELRCGAAGVDIRVRHHGRLWGGVITDQVAVPFADAMLVPSPDGIDVLAAASVGNVSDGYRHVAPYLPALLAEDAAAQVLIVGAASEPAVFTSSVGLYAGQVARALGARNVALADARRAVRDRAGQLGLAAVAPDEERGVNEARLVIVPGPERPLCPTSATDPADYALGPLTSLSPQSACRSPSSGPRLGRSSPQADGSTCLRSW